MTIIKVISQYCTQHYSLHTQDPNWYKARQFDGLEGVIPFNYVTEYNDTHSSGIKIPPIVPDSIGHHHNAAKETRGAVKLHTMP